MVFDSVRKLNEMYKEGVMPEPEELEGEQYVTVPVFPWVSFAPLKHLKDTDTNGEGANVMMKRFRFGRYNLVKKGDYLLVDYKQEENSRFMRGVVDRLRRIPDGRIIGRMYYHIFGREVFVSWFEMAKRD